MHDDSYLDRWIDVSLRTYADHSSDSDLAERILARLASEPAHRPRRAWLPWSALALPAAALCILLLLQSGQRTTKQPIAPPVASAVLHSPPGSSAHPQPHSIPEGGKRGQLHVFGRTAVAANGKQAPPHPRLSVFPTPMPLTPQERALAAYVAHTPAAARRALAQAQQMAAAPTVASIRVIPLEPPDEGTNTN